LVPAVETIGVCAGFPVPAVGFDQIVQVWCQNLH
jgi:hypothetical protein